MCIVLPVELIQKGIPTTEDRSKVRRYVRQTVRAETQACFATFFGSSIWVRKREISLASDLDVFIVFADDPQCAPNHSGIEMLRKLHDYAFRYHVVLNIVQCCAWQMREAPLGIFDEGLALHLSLANQHGGHIKGDFGQYVACAFDSFRQPKVIAREYLSRQVRWLGEWMASSHHHRPNQYEVCGKLISNHRHIQRKVVAALGKLPENDDSYGTVETLYFHAVRRELYKLGGQLNLLKEGYLDELRLIQQGNFDPARYCDVVAGILDEAPPIFSGFVAGNQSFLSRV